MKIKPAQATIMDNRSLAALKQVLRGLITENEFEDVFKTLELRLPKSSPKAVEADNLLGRLNASRRANLLGTISRDQHNLEENQVRAALLEFVGRLEVADFADSPTTAPSGKKKGSVLYRIPHRMQVRKRMRCVVRLAFDEAALLDDFDLKEEDVRKSITVAEEMEVHLLDPENGRAFDIQTRNSARQRLIEDEPTEWVFWVTPLCEGSFPLELKVVALKMVDGEKVGREIVLEEIVDVSTSEPEPAEAIGAGYRSAGYSFSFQSSAPAGVSYEVSPSPPAPASRIPGGVRAMAFFLVFLVAAPSFMFAMQPEPVRQYWLANAQATLTDNPAPLEKFIAEFEKTGDALAKKYVDRASFRKAEVTAAPADYRSYIEKFGPEGGAYMEAVKKLKTLEIKAVESLVKEPTAEKARRFCQDFPKSEFREKLVESLSTQPEAQMVVKNDLENRPTESGNIPPKENKTGPVVQPKEEGKLAEQKPVQSQKPPVFEEKPNQLDQKPKTETPSAESSKDREAIIKTIADSLVRVEGGTFEMGCKEGRDGDCLNDEKLHTVTVGSFSISKYEVTQAQWQAVMGENPSKNKGCNQCPVENVSWNDAQDFIKKLNALVGRNFRLPTEAEWEFAARGGNRSKHFQYAGGNNLKEVGWNEGSKSHPVGGLKANELGLFDMSGNVREWCNDWYGDYPSAAQNDPTGPKTGSARVNRGGSFVNIASNCRSANRYYNSPPNRLAWLGLRLARQ